MKKSFLLPFCFLLFAASCNDDDATPLEQLPDPTSEGKNTFGCLVNGEAWVAHIEDNHIIFGEEVLDVQYDEEDYLRIVAEREMSNVDQTMILHATVIPNNSSHLRKTTKLRDLEDSCNQIYSLDTLKSNQIEIINLDLDNKIISGTFEFTVFLENCDTLEITDGRFDAVYRY